MKIVSRILFLLLIINGALLYVHYSNSTVVNGSENEAYQEEIEVEVTKAGLLVKHRMKEIPTMTNQLIIPPTVSDFKCIETTQSTCERFNSSTLAIAASEGEQSYLTFTYILSPTMNEAGLKQWKKPFVRLKQGVPDVTTLQLIDRQKQGGMWLTGYELIGNNTTEEMDYLLFAGIGPVEELVWQKEKVALTHQSDRLTVYGEGSKDFAKSIEDLLQQFKSKHMTVVLHEGTHEVQSERILALPKSKKDEIEHMLFIKSVQTAYGIPFEERLISEVVSSILLEEPVGSDIGQQGYLKLIQALSANEMHTLSERLKMKEAQPLNAKKLDQILGAVTASRTTYFEKIATTKKIPELQLLIKEPLVFGDEIIEDHETLLKNGQLFFEMKKFTEQLGYEWSENEHSIYLTRSDEHYRFSKIDPFVVMKERRVDLGVGSYQQWNDIWYMDEATLRKVFQLIITYSEEQIEVQTLQSLLESE